MAGGFTITFDVAPAVEATREMVALCRRMGTSVPTHLTRRIRRMIEEKQVCEIDYSGRCIVPSGEMLSILATLRAVGGPC